MSDENKYDESDTPVERVEGEEAALELFHRVFDISIEELGTTRDKLESRAETQQLSEDDKNAVGRYLINSFLKLMGYTAGYIVGNTISEENFDEAANLVSESVKHGAQAATIVNNKHTEGE